MASPFEQLERGKKFLDKQIGDKFVNYFENQGQLGVADFLDPTKDRDKQGGVVKMDSTGKYYYDASKPGTTMPIGSFGQNVSQLRTMNGTTDNMGNRSVGDQELAQKENENNKTSMQQFNAMNFLKTFAGNVFDRILPDNRVEYTFPDGETIKINKDLKERLDNDQQLREEFNIKKTIPGMKEQPSYNLDGSLRDKSDPSTYPSGLGVGP
tara:strand:+ start:140 stop:769 length:630 start_codon:yes stop_codon:yes gene_type:complete